MVWLVLISGWQGGPNTPVTLHVGEQPCLHSVYFIFAKKDLDKNMDLYHTTEKNQDPFQRQSLIWRKKRCASGKVLFPFCMDLLHKFSPSDAEPQEVLSDFALVQKIWPLALFFCCCCTSEIAVEQMISITPVHLVVTSCTNLCTFDPAEVIISAFYVDTFVSILTWTSTSTIQHVDAKEWGGGGGGWS